MKDLFTTTSIGKDADGNLAVELRPAIGVVVIGIALSPLVVAAGYVLARAPLGYTPMVFAGLLAIIVLDAAGIAAMFLVRAQARARLAIDRARGVLISDSRLGRREFPIREVDRVEFGSAPSPKNPAVHLHRIEIVLRSQQRVPAVERHFGIAPADRDRVLEALNREIGVRSAMLS